MKRHILPALGRIGIRRLTFQQIEALHDSLLHPAEGRGPSPRTVYEIHLVIRGALTDAVRRGLVTRNVALIARAPKQRHLQRIEGVVLTDQDLRLLMCTAVTGMRRNEVLGIKLPDIDFARKRLHINRGLGAVGYEVHQTRGKTRSARRAIALNDTTLAVLPVCQADVAVHTPEQWVFTDGVGQVIHPHAISEAFRRIVHNAGVPAPRFHDLRVRHGSLPIKEGVSVKVVSERLADPRPAAKKKVTKRPRSRRWNVVGTAGGGPPDPVEPSENCESPGL